MDPRKKRGGMRRGPPLRGMIKASLGPASLICDALAHASHRLDGEFRSSDLATRKTSGPSHCKRDPTPPAIRLPVLP